MRDEAAVKADETVELVQIRKSRGRIAGRVRSSAQARAGGRAGVAHPVSKVGNHGIMVRRDNPIHSFDARKLDVNRMSSDTRQRCEAVQSGPAAI
jgi:hypothetical protein